VCVLIEAKFDGLEMTGISIGALFLVGLLAVFIALVIWRVRKIGHGENDVNGK